MKKIPFNVNAYTARLIGRENISNLEGAIIEIVKNSYDADANDCILYFENSSNIVYIIDNGIGMTEEIILKHWMTIGNSSKDLNYVSKMGRVQTGAKGIGRFALDRLSDKCEMYTVNNGNKIIWKVDWNTFSREENITDIYAEIENTEIDVKDFCKEIKNIELKRLISEKFNCGTVFKLDSLRNNEWNDEKRKEIKENLSKLIPPNVKNDFSIYFSSISFIEQFLYSGTNAWSIRESMRTSDSMSFMALSYLSFSSDKDITVFLISVMGSLSNDTVN